VENNSEDGRMKEPVPVQTNWVVITGAPSSGKTSVINELSRRGHKIMPEVARELIEACIAHGHTVEEIRSDDQKLRALQEKILQVQVIEESKRDPAVRFFLDRGMGDSITYSRRAGLDVRDMEKLARHKRYYAVFLFDRLPVVRDNVRAENNREAVAIDTQLEKDYRTLGYDVQRVPVMPVEQRADFILEALQKQDMKKAI
jgi:predicted ATPase